VNFFICSESDGRPSELKGVGGGLLRRPRKAPVFFPIRCT